MFKAPFSFDGRIRRIEYFLSGIVGGIVFSIAWALGIGTFILGAGMGSAGGSVFGLLIGLAALVASMWFSLAQGVKTFARPGQIRLVDSADVCSYC